MPFASLEKNALLKCCRAEDVTKMARRTIGYSLILRTFIAKVGSYTLPLENDLSKTCFVLYILTVLYTTNLCQVFVHLKINKGNQESRNFI